MKISELRSGRVSSVLSADWGRGGGGEGGGGEKEEKEEEKEEERERGWRRSRRE